MKFSVATPVFSGMPSLPKCVGSVKGQVLSKEAGYSLCDGLSGEKAVFVEHLIQDGGSKDDSVEFLRSLKVNNELQYQLHWESKADAGMYDAINNAWANASGDILSWLNSDEQYLPGTLQKVASYFEAHPAVDAVFGDTIITKVAGEPYAARREIPLRKTYVLNGFLYALSCSTFYRRNLWDRGLLRLDTQYRYAADADLVLRLMGAGVRFHHIKEFFGLFGVEAGRNLSFKPEMRVEMEIIKNKHGAFRSRAMRRAVLGFRSLERSISGCYLKKPVLYRYAENEVPEYREFSHPSLGFRFTYDRFSKEANENA